MEREKNKNQSFKSQSSVKSRHESIKRRVDKFTEEKKKYAGEKDDEYMERRKRKSARKKRVQRDRKLRWFKCLYWPSAIMLACGCVLTFGATVRSLGEGTIIWQERHSFKVIGPVLIAVGLVLFLATNAIVNNHKIRITKINQEEDLRRKESYKQQILQRYLKKQNGFHNENKRKLGRTISGTYSTCHSIEDMDDSSQILLTLSSASNASLHPFWRPMNRRESENDECSSRYLDISQNSNSTLMTSLRSNGSVGPCGLSLPLDLRKFNFIDEDETEDLVWFPKNHTPIKQTQTNGRVHCPREFRKVEFIDETNEFFTPHVEQSSC